MHVFCETSGMPPNPLSDRPNISLKWCKFGNLRGSKAQSCWFVNVRRWFRPQAAAETSQEYMINKESYNFAKVIKQISNLKDPQTTVCRNFRNWAMPWKSASHVTHSCFVTGNEARLWGPKPSRFERFTAPKLQTMYKLCKHIWDLTWSYCSYCTSSVHPMYIFSTWVQNKGVEQFSRLHALDASPSCTKQVSPGDQ